MSADNWANCPRCVARARALRAEYQRQAGEAYGKCPVEEFDALRAKAAEPIVNEQTFREDYEIYGAESGVITVSYSGSCSVCGLAATFLDERPIAGVLE